MNKKLLLMVLLAAAAFGASHKSTISTSSYSVSANGPTTLSQGIALQIGGVDVTNANITAQIPFDGGQGFQMSAISFRAWKMTPQFTQAQWDAGQAYSWSRWPQLDVALNLGDAGIGPTAYLIMGEGLTGSVVIPSTSNGSRLYYQYEGLAVLDAGTLGQANLTVEGVY